MCCASSMALCPVSNGITKPLKGIPAMSKRPSCSTLASVLRQLAERHLLRVCTQHLDTC